MEKGDLSTLILQEVSRLWTSGLWTIPNYEQAADQHYEIRLKWWMMLPSCKLKSRWTQCLHENHEVVNAFLIYYAAWKHGAASAKLRPEEEQHLLYKPRSTSTHYLFSHQLPIWLISGRAAFCHFHITAFHWNLSLPSLPACFSEISFCYDICYLSLLQLSRTDLGHIWGRVACNTMFSHSRE